MSSAEMSVDATERLDLRRPTLEDVPALFAILSDSRVWTHLPSGLHLVERGPDAGNPDPEAVRQVFADRELSDMELRAARR